jgi:hypothetical protein
MLTGTPYADFKKDFDKGGHAHHASVGDSHDKKDCPYMRKKLEQEAAEKAAKEATEHSEL